MRGMKALLVVALLVAVRAQAAVYGDFVVPSGLSSSPQGAAVTNRTAVTVPLQDGAMVVYFSVVPEYADTPLQSIAADIGNAANAMAMSLGGRPWFGVQRSVAGMGTYFEGYTHRNGMVYRVDVDLRSRPRPDAEVRQAFDRIWLFPGLSDMAGGIVAAAVDHLDRGDAENVLAVLDAAPPQDTGNWAAMLLRAMAEEMTGDLTAAVGSFASAAAMLSGAAEMSARAAGAAALAGTDDEAISVLISLAASAPEEPVVWEELGKVSLAQGNLTAAQGYFTQAASVNPADETALYNLAFIHAQNGDYAGALRRGRELLHYFPWVPNGAIPDVTSAPGMDESQLNMIMAEPLPLGSLAEYGAIAAQPLEYNEAQTIIQVIQVPATTPVYQPTYGPGWSYVPVVLFDWMWNVAGHRPWWNSGHRPRPPGNWHPGGPGIRPPRPPACGRRIFPNGPVKAATGRVLPEAASARPKGLRPISPHYRHPGPTPASPPCPHR